MGAPAAGLVAALSYLEIWLDEGAPEVPRTGAHLLRLHNRWPLLCQASSATISRFTRWPPKGQLSLARRARWAGVTRVSRVSRVTRRACVTRRAGVAWCASVTRVTSIPRGAGVAG